jgi:protein TonB
MQVDPQTRSRLSSAAAAAAFHALLGYLLLTGLGIDFTPPEEPRLATFDIAAEPPLPIPEPTPEPERRREREEGEASPENLKSRATPIVAPEPRIELPPPPPTLVAAPKPSTGAEATTGASDRPGPGTGAGGLGDGTGAGGRGTGPGGGGAPAQRARWTRGSISDSDYPRSASRVRASGTVIARLTIAPDGRVSACAITRSSNNADLDEATCRLIQKRFRYAPARDREGRAVPDTLGWKQEWWLEPRG